VAHHQFASMDAAAFRALCRQQSVLFDVKNILPASEVDGTL